MLNKPTKRQFDQPGSQFNQSNYFGCKKASSNA